MKKWIKITLWTLGSVLGLIIIVLCVALWLLTPDRLTPMVNKYASQYLMADVNFQRVEVSLFENFPDISIHIIQGNIVSRALATPDTLLHFNDLGLSLDLMGVITSSRVSVGGFSLNGARANMIIDTSGRASWDILKPSDSTVDTTSASAPMVFEINRVDITGGLGMTFNDRRDSTFIDFSFRDMHFEGPAASIIQSIDFKRFAIEGFQARGTLSAQNSSFSTTIPNISITRGAGGQYLVDMASRSTLLQQGDTVLNNLPVDFRSTLGFDFSNNRRLFTLADTKLSVSRFALGLSGSLELDTDSTMRSDLTLHVSTLSIDDLIALVPQKSRGALSNIKTDITLEMQAAINGSYNFASGKLPRISAGARVESGYLRYRGQRASIDNFELLATALYNPDTIALSRLALEKLVVKGSGVDINSTIGINDPFGDPKIEGQLTASINLGTISTLFPSPRGTVASGRIELKGRCDSRLSALSLSNIARAEVSGAAQLSQINIIAPQDSITLFTEGRLSFGSNKNTRDSTFAKGEPLLRARFVLDTLNLSVGSSMIVRAGALNVSARTLATGFAANPKREVRAINPLRGTITGRSMQVLAPDSSLLRLTDVNIEFNIQPDTADLTLPHLSSVIAARRVVARSLSSRYVLTRPALHFEATIISKERDSIQRATLMLDRLAKRYPKIERDQLLQYNRMMQTIGFAKKDDLASGDLDLKLDDQITSLMRRWRSVGRLQADRARVITPYIPLRTTLSDLNCTFTNNEIELHKAKVQVGRSDVSIEGEISNLRRAFAARGNLIVKLGVSGDTLDVNQLVTALNAGMSAAPAVLSDITDQTTEEQAAALIEAKSSQQEVSRLIIIPKNIDLDVKLNVDEVFYGDVILSELRGELVSRDRVLQINKLRAASSIGDMELNAVYATRSKTDITTGFDLTLDKVNVKELIELIPEVDSLLPMLKSFEGYLDCKFAATASLDSTMTLLIPTLNAAGSLVGKNMVLLDGETFTQIAKIMRFKNKARNVVDQISVEMLVRNSAVELFPFILQMDRYKAAVSGVQKLDMSFDYHISVLKSIIPFRLGVDIFGNLDNWDFKITQARYKDENIPSYTALIDTTRIDLRKAITDIFATGLDKLALKDSGIVPQIDSSKMALIDSLEMARSAQAALSASGDTIVGLGVAVQKDEPGSNPKNSKQRARKKR